MPKFFPNYKVHTLITWQVFSGLFIARKMVEQANEEQLNSRYDEHYACGQMLKCSPFKIRWLCMAFMFENLEVYQKAVNFTDSTEKRIGNHSNNFCSNFVGFASLLQHRQVVSCPCRAFVKVEKNLTIETLTKIAKALEVGADDLIK